MTHDMGDAGLPAMAADQVAHPFHPDEHPGSRPPVAQPNPYVGSRCLPKIVILAEAQNWRCAYCPTVMTRATSSANRPTDATIDHVIAQAAGGKKTWDNEVAACAACNSAKDQFSGMLFWLLMVREGFNRRVVAAIMHRMTKKQRHKLKQRLEGEAMAAP